ncbi:MAG TPA: bifunctional UDP-N-acetylglucosamine diphosphorylase/glucosamine-1-phosphate N-acetyltransferase GlmU [Beijerinckiaceae bacterium]|jgi:bifunctional UDP-N-acetylglucosamine pyrophosphorylase/glucosamine-1-phosphate N-acetyltransferase
MITVPSQASGPAQRSCLAVILAAGEGTRMRSARPKALHELAGRSMLGHVLAAVRDAGASRVAVVVGPDCDNVAAEAHRVIADAVIFVQRDRLGTAHAVLAAREALKSPVDDIIVAYADTPLIETGTLAKLRRPLADGAAVAVLGFEARDPTGYGRLILNGTRLAGITEEREATAAERQIRFCNAGLMALQGRIALDVLERIGNENAKGEYYLTDAVSIANAMGHLAVAVAAPEEEVQGINDRAQLADAERVLQTRLRQAAMANGATLVDPETVFFSHDTKIGRDVVIEPHVFFGRGVTVEDDVVIHGFSHLEGARLARGASVGPFARLRPGADLGPNARVGNFVEIKNAQLAAGVKVNHLTYLGDATIGANVNIGAGTITCNYDGFAKHRTTIGEGAFVGTNSSLVAPVTIGSNAYIGSGSVITQDVPADALALGRGRQAIKEGWATEFRNKAKASKRS